MILKEVACEPVAHERISSWKQHGNFLLMGVGGQLGHDVMNELIRREAGEGVEF